MRDLIIVAYSIPFVLMPERHMGITSFFCSSGIYRRFPTMVKSTIEYSIILFDNQSSGWRANDKHCRQDVIDTKNGCLHQTLLKWSSEALPPDLVCRHLPAAASCIGAPPATTLIINIIEYGHYGSRFSKG